MAELDASRKSFSNLECQVCPTTNKQICDASAERGGEGERPLCLSLDPPLNQIIASYLDHGNTSYRSLVNGSRMSIKSCYCSVKKIVQQINFCLELYLGSQ